MTEEESKKERDEGAENMDLEFYGDVLAKVYQSSYAGPFLEPVDPVALNVPDYFEKIKNPIALSDIKRKYDNGEYSGSAELISDMELMFNNCYTYNSPGSPVYKMGTSLQRYFAQTMQRAREAREKKRKTRQKEETETKRIKKGAKIDPQDASFCMEVLSELQKKKHEKINWPFLEPVNPKQVPTYYTIIKNPMDLSTMRKKLERREYEGVEDFVSDFNLLINNCFTFNHNESEVYKCAQKLDSLFKTIIEGKKRERVKKGMIEKVDITNPKEIEAKILELKRIISSCNAELKQLEAMSGVEKMEKKEMIALKTDIESLSEEKLRNLATFLRENLPGACLETEGEIEVNFDIMPTSQLKSLKEFVDKLEGRREEKERESDTETA